MAIVTSLLNACHIFAPMCRGMFALTLGLISASAIAGNRGLQESTQGACVSVARVSGRHFQEGQGLESLQVMRIDCKAHTALLSRVYCWHAVCVWNRIIANSVK